MSANENSPSVGLDLYNEANIYLLLNKTKKQSSKQNIARGTKDPEIDSVTWIKLGNNMAPFTLVAILATRWRHLH